MSIFLFKNKFYFRPKIDIGSYSRLTKSQYIIKGTPNQPIETIIDAGANIGSQAIRFINLNSKLKNIICIEPDVDSSKLCEKNLKNYNAKIYNNALTNTSDKDLTILKTINSEMSEIVEGSNQIIQSNNYHTIKTISINDIIKKERIDKIDFLKLDINGYEDELFEKNTEWLKITNSIGFNNADINKTTLKIITKYTEHVRKIKIYNIDQMIFLIKDEFDWLPQKGFMSSKNIGFVEIDQRYWMQQSINYKKLFKKIIGKSQTPTILEIGSDFKHFISDAINLSKNKNLFIHATNFSGKEENYYS